MSTFKVDDRVRYHGKSGDCTPDMIGMIGTVTNVDRDWLSVTWDSYGSFGCYPKNVELVPEIKVGDMVWIRVDRSRGGSTRCDKTRPHKITAMSGKWFVVDMNYYAAEDLELATMSIEVEKALALLKQHGTVTFVPKFKPVTVKLNGEYNAIVQRDGVKVGCQIFSFDKVLELAETVQKVKAQLKQ